MLVVSRIDTCGTIPIVSSAIVIGSSNAVGSVLKYQCDVGFYLVGNDTVVCQASGLWTAVPICRQQENTNCGPVPTISNGITIGTSNNIGATVTFNCLPGYNLQGPSQSGCQPNGQWSQLPFCTIGTSPVQFCSNVPQVPLANANTTENVVGTYVRYQCSAGFATVGRPVIVCLTNGSWTNPPRCERDCGLPPQVLNSVFSSSSGDSSTIVGNVLTFTCLSGFSLLGNNQVTCLPNGQWSQAPQCVQGSTRCPSVPQVPNAVANSTQQNAGASIAYICNSGYLMRGFGYIICQNNGSWSQLPSCVRDCGQPPQVANAGGRPISSDTGVGSLFQYSCAPGFTLIGSAAVTCLNTGDWSDLPQCIAPTCGSPPTITDGIIISANSTVATYSCAPNRAMVGSSIIVCSPNTGRWSQAPFCSSQSPCGTPPTVDKAAILSSNISTVIYSCSLGSSFTDGRNYVRCDPNTRQWTVPPQCVSNICPPVPFVANSISRGDAVSVGSTVLYSCAPGFAIDGPELITCQADGTWTSAPKCVQRNCGPPGDILNGLTVSANSTHAVYQCFTGYVLVGKSTIRCINGTTWDPAPLCAQGSSCGAPPNIDNGYLSRYSPDTQTASYSCVSDRYYLYGTSTINCVTGLWRQPFPQCLPIGVTPAPARTCGNVPDVANASPNSTSSSIGSTVGYTCSAGYRIQGSPFVTCQVNLQWSQAPQCVAVALPCPPPPAIANGRIKLQTTQVVVYECFPNYQLTSSETVVCRSDSTWSTIPACLPLQQSTEAPRSCGKPAKVDNAVSFGDRTEVGSTVLYRCNDGYELQGNDFITCTVELRWTSPPVCQRKLLNIKCALWCYILLNIFCILWALAWFLLLLLRII